MSRRSVSVAVYMDGLVFPLSPVQKAKHFGVAIDGIAAVSLFSIQIGLRHPGGPALRRTVQKELITSDFQPVFILLMIGWVPGNQIRMVPNVDIGDDICPQAALFRGGPEKLPFKGFGQSVMNCGNSV